MSSIDPELQQAIEIALVERDIARAADLAEEALAKGQRDPMLLNLAAWKLEEAEEFDAAHELLGEALALAPGDPAIIGRKIRLNNWHFTVIGVTPEEFQGSILGLRFELYLPATMREAVWGSAGPLNQRGSKWLVGHARLGPGVDLRQAA